MKKGRETKGKKNSKVLQWVVFIFILGSVAFSGFSSWKVHNLQSEVTHHENAINILEEILNPINELNDIVIDFDKSIIELDYFVNESVSLGSMTVPEADAAIEALVKTYHTSMVGHCYAIDQIFAVYGLDENLDALEEISPGIAQVFKKNDTYGFLEFFWANPNYKNLEYYTMWNFFSYFVNTNSSTEAYTGVYNLLYSNTSSIMNSSFWGGYNVPFTFSYRIHILPLYIRNNHSIPMIKAENQIQGYILGNGINAIAILILGFVVNFDDSWLLKIISLVISVALLGFSLISILLF